MIIYGQEDDVVQFNNFEALNKQFLYLNNLELSSKGSITKHLGGTEKEYTQTEYKDRHKTIVEVLKIKHLGHAWSGGDKRYPFNSNKGPQAMSV
ncbi:PHB depolymerase family esterase [Oligella ureolytica]